MRPWKRRLSDDERSVLLSELLVSAENLCDQAIFMNYSPGAVAPLDRLAALALGLARPGGTVLAIKGANASQEVAAARPALKRLGVRSVDVVRAGDGKVDPATTVVRLIAGP